MTGSNTSVIQCLATVSSSTWVSGMTAWDRKVSRSLRIRLAWFSPTSRPVSSISRRRWCPGVDHLGLHHHVRVAVHLVDVESGDVVAQFVEPAQSLLDPPPLVVAHGLRLGQLLPQPLVPVHHRDRSVHRVDRLREPPGHLQIQQLAGQVGLRDVQVCRPLPRGQFRADLAGLRVHQVGGQRAGIPAEQGVRQRAVVPGESGQVQPDQQLGQGVQQLRFQVGVQPAGEQRAIGQREPQMLGDQCGVQRLAVRRSCGWQPRRRPRPPGRLPGPGSAASRTRARPAAGRSP